MTLIDNLENTSQISADTEYKVFNIGSKFDYKRKDFRTVLSANFNRDMRYKHHLSSASARQEITIAKGHKLNLYSDVTDRYVFSQDTTSELGFLYRLNYFGRIKNKINIGITSYYGDKKIYGYGRGEKYLKSLLGFKINNKHSISSETRFRDRDTDIKTANYTYKNKDREFVSDLLFNARLNNTLKLKSGLQIAGYEIKTIGNGSKNKSNLLNLKLESSLKFSNNHHMRFNMLAGIRETKIVNEFTDEYPNFFLELDHTFRGLFTRLIYEYGTNQLSSLYSSRNTERLNANVRFRQFLLDDKLKLEASAYSNYYFRNKQLSTTYLLESSYDLGSNFEPFIRGYYALYQNLSLKVITNDNYYIEAGIRKGISTHLKKYERSDLYITFFKDFNNNGIFDENDEPIPGISTSLSVKNLLHKNIDGKDNLNDNITGVTIYSSTDGEVVYKDIPTGKYLIDITSISDLEGWRPRQGNTFDVDIIENNELQVPYISEGKIYGNIKVLKTNYSRLNTIRLDGIKITATDIHGNKYETLTELNGSYILSVPKNQFYKVSAKNTYSAFATYINSNTTADLSTETIKKRDFTLKEKIRKINLRKLKPNSNEVKKEFTKKMIPDWKSVLRVSTKRPSYINKYSVIVTVSKDTTHIKPMYHMFRNDYTDISIIYYNKVYEIKLDSIPNIELAQKVAQRISRAHNVNCWVRDKNITSERPIYYLIFGNYTSVYKAIERQRELLTEGVKTKLLQYESTYMIYSKFYNELFKATQEALKYSDKNIDNIWIFER